MRLRQRAQRDGDAPLGFGQRRIDKRGVLVERLIHGVGDRIDEARPLLHARRVRDGAHDEGVAAPPSDGHAVAVQTQGEFARQRSGAGPHGFRFLRDRQGVKRGVEPMRAVFKLLRARAPEQRLQPADAPVQAPPDRRRVVRAARVDLDHDGSIEPILHEDGVAETNLARRALLVRRQSDPRPAAQCFFGRALEA